MNLLNLLLLTRIARKKKIKLDSFNKEAKNDLLFLGEVVRALLEMVVVVMLGGFKVIRFLYNKVSKKPLLQEQNNKNIINLKKYKESKRRVV